MNSGVLLAKDAPNIGRNCDFQVAQGSIVMHLRWGGKPLQDLCTKFPLKYTNEIILSTFIKVMVKNPMSCFFVTQCICGSFGLCPAPS